MTRRYSRQEFLNRLRSEIGRGRPLVMTSLVHVAGFRLGVCWSTKLTQVSGHEITMLAP